MLILCATLLILILHLGLGDLEGGGGLEEVGVQMVWEFCGGGGGGGSI